MSKRQFLIIGLGTFGINLARYLSEKNAEVTAIDRDEQRTQEASSFLQNVITGDATDEKMLRSIGLSDIDVAVVSLSKNLESSILITLLLRELGAKKIIVKSINQMHARIATRVGADRVIYPEVEMAKKLAESLVSPNILEEIELSPDYNLVEIVVPKKFWNKTLRQANIRGVYNLNVIAIKRKVPILNDAGESDIKEEINIAPLAEDEFAEGDIIVVIGKEPDIEKLNTD
ncbi:MAG: TrkA family potassium uptake protein [Elusimicrobia bacterium]|nr:TrkA family potassium uptake protein [Elusimicrobiota bacterium]